MNKKYFQYWDSISCFWLLYLPHRDLSNEQFHKLLSHLIWDFLWRRIISVNKIHSHKKRNAKKKRNMWPLKKNLTRVFLLCSLLIGNKVDYKIYDSLRAIFRTLWKYLVTICDEYNFYTLKNTETILKSHSQDIHPTLFPNQIQHFLVLIFSHQICSFVDQIYYAKYTKSSKKYQR